MLESTAHVFLLLLVLLLVLHGVTALSSTLPPLCHLKLWQHCLANIALPRCAVYNTVCMCRASLEGRSGRFTTAPLNAQTQTAQANQAEMAVTRAPPPPVSTENVSLGLLTPHATNQ